MTTDELIHKADITYEKAYAYFMSNSLLVARDTFREAYRLYRKNGSGKYNLNDAAFYLSLCLIETDNRLQALQEAEDLLISYVRDDETIVDGIPRIFILGKAYSLMGKSKLMRMVCRETIEAAVGDENLARCLAGATYAATTEREAYRYAIEALPLLRATNNCTESMAIVLAALAQDTEGLPAKERMEYSEELLVLLNSIKQHPILPSLTEAYMIQSYICAEQALWESALMKAKLALNTTADMETSNVLVSSIYRHIAYLYNMMGDTCEATVAMFEALKAETEFIPDPPSNARALHGIGERLAQCGLFRFAAKAEILSLRCLIDDGDHSFSQLKSSIVALRKYDNSY